MKTKRGPKPKPKAAPGGALWEGFELPEALTDGARREFGRLVAAMTRVGTVEATDPYLVLTAARVSDLLTRALDQIDSEGMTVVSGNGSECRHPALSQVNPLTMRVRALWSDLGLTAESSKLGGAKPEAAESKWGGMLGIHTG